ncbi:hypothetical protein [Chryseobacterium sp. POE27]|uniref:hypothetical protein n=1 Tax=Chryseobacterium sp. POE27 TaxID=3138177 RepID=UPI00321AD271
MFHKGVFVFHHVGEYFCDVLIKVSHVILDMTGVKVKSRNVVLYFSDVKRDVGDVE